LPLLAAADRWRGARPWPAAPGVFRYSRATARGRHLLQSATAGSETFLLNTMPHGSQAEASQACRGLGGNLVSYRFAAEQLEVEAAFVSMGALIPSFHRSYLLGYQVGGPVPWRAPAPWRLARPGIACTRPAHS
jgi:hypothetical protein